MITLYLIGLVVKICIWLILLPFKIVLFPFRILFGFGRPRKQHRNAYEDGLIEGLIIGSLWD